MHKIIRKWCSYQKGDTDQQRKFFGEQVYNIRNAGTQYFPHTNFFRSLGGHKRHKTVESEAGNKNGDARKYFIELGELVFLFVKVVYFFIQELILINIIRVSLAP
jgi:hypothetical protein